jgi:hypothetical protein
MDNIETIRENLRRELRKRCKGKSFIVTGAPLSQEVPKLLKRMAHDEKKARKTVIMVG